jgi:hypothetical protein
MINIIYILLIYYVIVVLASRIHKHNCWGFSIFRIYRWQVELWICPPHTQVPMHKHPNEYTNLWFVKGKNTTIFRNDIQSNEYEEYALSFPKVWGKLFYLAPTQFHGFMVGNHWLIFFNFQRWLKTPTSAAHDFVKLQQDLPIGE